MSTHHQEDELMDLVDENDVVIGQKLRSEIYAEEIYNFRVVNAFVINQKGELWIPRRSAHKRRYPSCLDLGVGGHVESGESYDQALAREVKEELNLDVSQLDVRLLGHLYPHKDNVSVFMQVYEIHLDEVPDYNRDDFVAFFWMKPQELMDKIKQGVPAKTDIPPLLKRFYL